MKNKELEKCNFIKNNSFELSLLELLYDYTDLNPKVSIIVPSYNHAIFLEKRLNSILNQTFQDFEIILLDDMSTDNTKEILKQFVQKRPSSYIYSNSKNSGSPFIQWAFGISKAQSDLIWIAEDDDYCENSFLETLLPCFNNKRVNLAYSNSYVIDENDKVIMKYEEIFSKLSKNKWNKNYINHSFLEIQEALAIRNTIPNASAVVFKKIDIYSILEELKNFKFAGDWFFYLNVLKKGDIAFVSEKLNYHRRHSTSTMSLLKDDIKLYFDEIQNIHTYVNKTFLLTQQTTDMMSDYIMDEWVYKNIDDDIEKYYKLSKLKEVEIKKTMNIVMFISGYYFGGAEIFPINLANAFAEIGHNIYLFDVGALDTNPKVKQMVSPLVKQIDSDTIAKLNKTFEEFLLSENIDVLNTQGWYASDFVQKNISIDTKHIPWFISMHGHEEAIINGKWGEYYDNYFPKFMDSVVALAPNFICTHEKNLEVFKFYKLQEESQIINLPILGMDDSLPESSLRSELNIEHDSFVISFVARGIIEKGWFEVIESAKILREKYNCKVDFILIGDSDLVQTIKEKNKLAYLHFLGLSDAVLSYGQISDISMLPSYYKSESHPLAIMGYLLCSNPVITTSLGNIPEMIDYNGEKAGLLLELTKEGKTDPNDIAMAIKSYIDKPKLLERHRLLARRAFDKFNMQRAANEYIQTFSKYPKAVMKNKNLKKTLYIHIGMPKTGTSAIQKFLVENEDILKNKYNLYYPDFGRWVDGSHHKIAFALSNNPYEKMKENSELSEYLTQLETIIDLSSCDNILLSSECFHLYNNKQFVKRFKEKYNIKIICYIRRQDEYLESLYGQNVRDNVFKETRVFSEFLDSQKENLFFSEILNRWENLTDANNFIIKIYEKKKFLNNNIIEDFMDIFKISIKKRSFINNKSVTNKSVTNISFTKEIIEYKRLINKVLKRPDDKLLYILNRYTQMKRSQKTNKLNFFENNERKIFLEFFEEDNKKIIQKYNLKHLDLFTRDIQFEKIIHELCDEEIFYITEFIYNNNKTIFTEIYMSILDNQDNDEIIEVIEKLQPSFNKLYEDL